MPKICLTLNKEYNDQQNTNLVFSFTVYREWGGQIKQAIIMEQVKC